MEKPSGVEVARFSSCRGVAFEIKNLDASPLAITVPPLPPSQPPALSDATQNGRWVWLPWVHAAPPRVFPYVSTNNNPMMIARSLSRPSSHFCDLTDDQHGEGDEEELVDVEAQKINGYEEPEQLLQKENSMTIKRSGSVKGRDGKPKKESRLSIILLDQGLFTVYKRLFAVSIILNVIALILAATSHFLYAKNHAALFSIGNILALTLCRSEAFLRIVFWLAVKLFGHPWIPLFLKSKITALLQSIGGIHSGCGVSSIAWLIYALVQTLHDRDNTSPEIIGVASAILSLLCISALAAFPLVRHLHHNVFERTHRFAGWGALLLLWAFVLLTIGYNPDTKSYDNLKGSKLIKIQDFWFTTALTILIVLPWLTVKRVPVKVTAPSGHASFIRFSGGVKPGLLGRISRSPLSEWHAFGIISDGKDEHIMLAGAVGDFTKGLVLNPPKHLWVRQLHFAGLPYLINMYSRVLMVATGSGICVFLSFLLQNVAADVCCLWVTKGVEQNFGMEIKEMMSGYPNGKVIIHDTAVHGRPNIAQMSIDAAKNWKAEMVVVTSNPQGSRDVVNACKGAGFHAFGPIWDS